MLVLLLVRQGVAVLPRQSVVTCIEDSTFVCRGQLISTCIQCLFNAKHVALKLVPGRHSFSLLLVLLSIPLCICQHLVYILLTEATFVVLDRNVFRFPGAFVLCRHVQDTVGIDVECDLDLRNSSRCRWGTSQVKLAQKVVVFGHGPFTLKHLDVHTRLIVSVTAVCQRSFSFRPAYPMTPAVPM